MQIAAAVLAAATAVSGYAGVVGLIGGGISFGAEIDARLPFDSLVLAGVALFCFVALPITVAAVATVRPVRHAADLMFAAGLLLVAWIAIELIYIKTYSWFHPTYLAVAFVVLGFGWLLERLAARTSG